MNSCSGDTSKINIVRRSVFLDHKADAEEVNDLLPTAVEGVQFNISGDVKKGEELLLQYPLLRGLKAEGGEDGGENAGIEVVGGQHGGDGRDHSGADVSILANSSEASPVRRSERRVRAVS